MTIIISLIGFVGRFAGALLTTALGWAASLLFGEVPRSHRILVVLMLTGSLIWMCLIVAAILPAIPGFFISVTPHPAEVNNQAIAIPVLIGIAVMPLGVGLAAYLVPADVDRPNGLGIAVELLRGYLLTPILSVLLLFLPAVGIARKVRSVSRRWSDVHIPIVVKPNGYDRLVRDLQDALASVDLEVEAEDAPRVLSLPAWLLTRVAGGNVAKLRPDRLVELERPDLRIGIYPSDIAISGPTHDRTRARAAILSKMTTTAASMTTSAEARAIEDRLGRLAERLGSEVGLSPVDIAVELAGIDETLLDLEVPTDEWDILYRLRLQVERDLLAGEPPVAAFESVAATG